MKGNRGVAGDRMEYVPEAVRRGAAPSSFLVAEDMKARAEKAARDRRLKAMAHGMDPDIDAETIVASARAREAEQNRLDRWLGWQRRRFSAWLRTKRCR